MVGGEMTQQIHGGGGWLVCSGGRLCTLVEGSVLWWKVGVLSLVEGCVLWWKVVYSGGRLVYYLWWKVVFSGGR